MRGVIVFSHGTGGSSEFIESTEAFAMALAMVLGGFGVLGTEAEEAAGGDLNGDGWPDLAVANVNANTVSVLLGKGAGGYGAKTDFATGRSP